MNAYLAWAADFGAAVIRPQFSKFSIHQFSHVLIAGNPPHEREAVEINKNLDLMTIHI